MSEERADKKTEHLLAGILAGGQSRRLGSDKALIMWKGRTLLEWSAHRAASLTDDIFILAKEEKPYTPFGYPILTDLSSTVTPLSGILTVAPFVRDWLLLLACDILIFSEELLKVLWEHRRSGHAVVVRSDEGLQPFLGLYPAGHLNIWEEAYRKGHYKLQPTLARMDTLILESRDLERQLGKAPLFLNVNRPKDISFLQSMVEWSDDGRKSNQICSHKQV